MYIHIFILYIYIQFFMHIIYIYNTYHIFILQLQVEIQCSFLPFHTVAWGGRGFTILGKFFMKPKRPKEDKGESVGNGYFMSHSSISPLVCSQVLSLHPTSKQALSFPVAPTNSPLPPHPLQEELRRLVSGDCKVPNQLGTRNGGEERVDPPIPDTWIYQKLWVINIPLICKQTHICKAKQEKF